MGTFKFSPSKINVENSDMNWFVVPKDVSLSYNNVTTTDQNYKLYFFIDGNAEISVSTETVSSLLFLGSSKDVKLNLSNPNIELITVTGNEIEINISSFSSSSQIKEINMYDGSVSFTGDNVSSLSNIVIHVPKGLESYDFVQGLDSSQYTLVYDLVYIADNVNYLEIIDKYNKLKSELSKVKSLILLNNDNELQDLLFVKLLLLNKEITNTKKQIDEYEDATDF